MPVSSRVDLINYCLRRLGAPVITIDVDPDQVEDRIDDSLERYADYHFEGTSREYYAYQVTPTDITNQYITIPDDVIFVQDVVDGGIMGNLLTPMGDPRASWVGFNPFTTITGASTGYASSSTGDHAGGGSGIMSSPSDFFLTMNHMEMIGDLFGVNDFPIRFNRNLHRVYVDVDWTIKLVENSWIIFDTKRKVDPELFTTLYNDRWLKEYSTALIKRQWGSNLIKFGGIQLPGAVTLDGDKLFDEAQQTIERLEEEMSDKYELPPLPEFG